jgi:hypothetical protein
LILFQTRGDEAHDWLELYDPWEPGDTLTRVSSKEQEKEGFSIPAQLKMLKEYAAANGFAVANEYVDIETAKQTGRAAFGGIASMTCATFVSSDS